MRRKNFTKFMKLAAFINIFIFLYPAFILFRYYELNSTGGILGAAIVLFSMYFGMAATKFICRKEYYFTTRLLSYISILIPILISIGVYAGKGIPRIGFEAVLAGIFYVIGSLNFAKSYSEIFSKKTLGMDMFFLTAVLILVSGISALNPIKGIIFIFVIFNIPLTMFIISEGNIDEVFLTRGVEIPEVQRSIRKGNIKLIAIFYAIILVLFNIKNLVSVLVKYCFIAYFKILFFILYLISLVYPADQNGGGGGNGQPPDLEIRESNNTANMIFNTIAIVLIIIILYKLAPIFVRKIKALIKSIRARLAGKIKIADNSAYNDNECEEIIEITKKFTHSRFTWKKKTNLFSLLRKTKEPAERIRLMYRIILTELDKKGVDIGASDTAGQVVRKAQSAEGFKTNLENITPIYEKVRYGEEEPDSGSLTTAEENLLKITGKSRV